ncbi:MAG TPA: glycosyltransferase family 39 protein [Terriglobales bacterium]|nr:glycosyltransferase family 39 protein [Terriglobales bacterium]
MGTLAAIAFRLLFFFKFRMITYDSFVYGDIAKNWLQHGIYGLDQPPDPTFVRLPGYPMFIAALWSIVGVEHYNAILLVQIAVDVLTCFVIADLARRLASQTAAKVAFVLTALCPFFANYTSAALTETLAILFAAAAFDAAVAALEAPTKKIRWVICGLALAAGILLRPDGGMLLMVIAAYSFVIAIRRRQRTIFVGAVLAAFIALAPLIPWTVRNWRVFHVFQPLTTTTASMPWEFVPHGFHRWTRTWIADYSSVEDIWFKVDGEPISVGDLPRRAIDDETQHIQTENLFAAYAENGNAISPELDTQFNLLAELRIRSHPLRYYVGLPLLRAADLWLRPRTEMLPIDSHWWMLRQDDPPQFRWAILLAAINIGYILLALRALLRNAIPYFMLFVSFMLLRTAFLAWMPNPEPRYVLECYPAIIALAACGLVSAIRPNSTTKFHRNHAIANQ